MSLENQARTYAMEKAGWDERSVCHPQAEVVAPDFQAQENKPRLLFLLGNAKEKKHELKLESGIWKQHDAMLNQVQHDDWNFEV